MTQPRFQFSLRTLLVLTAVLPPLTALFYFSPRFTAGLVFVVALAWLVLREEKNRDCITASGCIWAFFGILAMSGMSYLCLGSDGIIWLLFWMLSGGRGMH